MGGRGGSRLHYFDVFGVFVVQLREIEHQAGQKRLAGALRCGAQTAGETELDGTRSFMDLDGGRETQHVVHGRVHETHGARDGGADDGTSGRALPLSGITGDSLSLVFRQNGMSTHAAYLAAVSSADNASSV